MYYGLMCVTFILVYTFRECKRFFIGFVVVVVIVIVVVVVIVIVVDWYTYNFSGVTIFVLKTWVVQRYNFVKDTGELLVLQGILRLCEEKV